VRADYILIVEKETVFFHLLMEADPLLAEAALLVTGKGYPDFATRAFVK